MAAAEGAEGSRPGPRFRTMLASIGDGVIAVDLDGSVIFMNAVAERLTGWPQVEAQGRSIHEVFRIRSEESGAPVPNPVEKVLRDGTVQGLANHTLLVARDGTERPIDDSGAPVQDDNGNTIGAILVFRDITERRRIERENAGLLERERQARRDAEEARDTARAAEKRLEFLAEASNILAASLDYEATLQAVAKMAVPGIADWCAVDLLSAEGRLERLAVEHVDPTKVAWAREIQRRMPPDPDSPSGSYNAIQTREPEFYPEITDEMLVASARDAEQLEMARAVGFTSAIIAPLVARDRALGVLTFVTAETKRKYDMNDVSLALSMAKRAALAIDNARLYHEAQAAIKARDEFMSIASHELRSPLTALRGHAQMILRRVSSTGQLSEKDKDALNLIVLQTARLNQMISTMLDVSRIETGQFSLDRARLDIVSLTRGVVEEMRVLVEGREVELVSPSGPLIIDGDELRLREVLLNLLHNAAEYDPSGNKIQVIVQEKAERVCISVIDQGIGIPPAAQRELFHRFYRAPNASALRPEGFGIGLYVVREIVELHRGEVSVESREGEGSTFTICLPLPMQTQEG